MKITHAFLALSLSTSTGFSLAEDQINSTDPQVDTYQHQIGIGSSRSENELNEGSFSFIHYRYFFEPVNQADVPMRLTDHLAQSSDIGIQYIGLDSWYQYQVDGQYVFDNKLFIGGGYKKFTQQDEGYEDLDQTLAVTLGYYIGDYSSVTFEYQKGREEEYPEISLEERSHYHLVGSSYIPFSFTSGLYLVGSFKYQDETDTHESYGQEYVYEDYDKTFKLASDWYLFDSWSIGADYAYQEDGYGDEHGIVINTAANWRIGKIFSIYGMIGKGISDNNETLVADLKIDARF